eukprot:gene5366-9174_t
MSNFNYNSSFQPQQNMTQRNVSQQYPVQKQQNDFKISEWPQTLAFDPLYEKFSPIMPSWVLAFTEKNFTKTLTFALLDEILFMIKKNTKEHTEGIDIYIMMRTFQPSQATPLVRVTLNKNEITIPLEQYKLKHTKYVIPIPISNFCLTQNVLSVSSSGVSTTVQPANFSMVFGVFIGYKKDVASVKSQIRIIPFHECFANVTKTFKDSEVEELFYQISTNCPFTQTKIKIPVRSIDCKHLQCFDLDNYFELNQKTHIWKCPCCLNIIGIDKLVIDAYFVQILRQAPEDVDHVKVYSTGSIQFARKKNKKTEIIEISDDEGEDVTEDDIKEWLEISLEKNILPTEEMVKKFSSELETSEERVKK